MKTNEKPSRAAGKERFGSVLDLVKATADEPERLDEFEKFLADTRISRMMIQFRTSAGLTQAEVAARMECSQSAVSKLEHSADGDLKISEIAAHLRAVRGRMGIVFGPHPTIAERIKTHVVGLRHEIGKLAKMADENDDEQLSEKINRFGEEAWFNMLLVLLDAAAKFAPCEADEAEPPISVTGVGAEAEDSGLAPAFGG